MSNKRYAQLAIKDASTGKLLAIYERLTLDEALLRGRREFYHNITAGDDLVDHSRADAGESQ